mmetsp:Transcript_9571/g.17968  ORF Transcript_9571/g.17968 Transcript_9571/m.17968 type:complete len:110 (+) Transcript_9571:38-367(+)|eukprot:CAMPEP_0114433606 /NCGR_PEP_ID=MMETSP0103-20121206/11782_1 /TAXON_ID=37642 ORGANISM="Paraphysomonas imperforata, Strain PA2" /NCGR_SAMPLE_ID=MMETSP0103 /ASSEMBLY_ACC=CAM_ASM_000201 /LENGTH=109 /DNA_ID=CAMNT_0001603367 /DNA_START=38 /DNA_END=367 /DNA_ORIENTATION=+
MSQSQFPTLTFEQAKVALDEVIAAFEEPDAKAKMEAALVQTAALEPMQKMMALMPVVQEVQAAVLVKYGFTAPGAVMNGVMQIQQHAAADPSGDMAAKCQMLMAKASGR